MCVNLPGDIPLRIVESMPDFADALLEDRYGTIIALEVTTGAKKNSFPAGYNVWEKDHQLPCDPAVEGKANRAVITLVSRILDVPSYERRYFNPVPHLPKNGCW